MFTWGNDEKEENFMVIAADIPALVAFLLDMRNLDPENYQLHLGLDGGQSVLKVCLLVCDLVQKKLEPSRKGASHAEIL